MTSNESAYFHQMYGEKKPRAIYYKKDFFDYAAMIAVTAFVTGASFGFRHPMSIAVYVLCAFTLTMFATRHGVGLVVPLLVRRPQDLLYMVLYKLRNLKPMYFVAIAVLLLENYLVLATPNLPHHVALMRKIGLTLFFVHFLAITVYRTVILFHHLRKRELVREVLMQTAWKKMVNEKTNITLEILHAYFTGVLAHAVLIAPWYFVIRYFNFSLLFLPVVAVINIVVHFQWWKGYNRWFYRDHWLGHNSELEFIFLHGVHHDAIPSGLIAVAENGYLEGFLRFALGSPVPLYNPIVTFLICSFDVKTDIDMHQYIPGIFPKIPKGLIDSLQHSTHHYGSLEPYGIGVKVDRPGVPEGFKKAFAWVPDGLKNSGRLDEELTGFKWDNPTHRLVLSLYEKYHV